MLEMEEHGCASGGEDDEGRGTVWYFSNGISRMRWKSMGVLLERKMMVNLRGTGVMKITLEVREHRLLQDRKVMV